MTKFEFSKQNIKKFPFPHIDVDSALEKNFVNKLINSFPNENFFKNKTLSQSGRFDLGRWDKDFYRFLKKNKEWKDLYINTNSLSFVNHLFDVFNEELNINQFKYLNKDYKFSNHIIGYERKFRKLFRTIITNTKIGKYLEIIFGKRYCVSFSLAHSRDGYISPPHFDAPWKLFVILFYLSDEEEFGGKNSELLLHEVKENGELPIAKKIKIKKGRCILFLNNKKSIHSVKKLSGLTVPRKFLYVSVSDRWLKDAWQ